MKTATIKIEFSTGTTILDAFTEAVRLANLLNVFVEFEFNDVTCLASPGGDPIVGINAYYNADTLKEHNIITT